MRNAILLTTLAAVALGAPATAKDKKPQPQQLTVGRTPMAAPVEVPPPPPPAPVTTIADALPTLPNHATLGRLVQAAQLTPVFAGPGPVDRVRACRRGVRPSCPSTIDTLLKPRISPASPPS